MANQSPSQNDNGFRTFQASPALSAWIAVDVQSDGTITPSAAGGTAVPGSGKGIGVTQESVPTVYYANVKLWSAPGTFMLQCTGSAITVGTQYAITSGGFATATGTGCVTPQLVALGSAVASNGIVVEFAKI